MMKHGKDDIPTNSFEGRQDFTSCNCIAGINVTKLWSVLFPHGVCYT